MRQDQLGGQIVAETPANANCFVGFHDIIPWSEDESCLALHCADSSYFAMGDTRHPIDICLWFPKTGEMRKEDSTNAWNFQQGSRLQWLPGQKNTIAFNAIEDGQAVSVLRNVLTSERRVLKSPIYSFTPDGKFSITPNFTTLAHRWKAYGYVLLAESPEISSLNEDGIWEVDLDSGDRRLLISTERAAEFKSISGGDYSRHFLCHPSVSPDGKRIVFLHRFFGSDGGLFTRMIAADREGRELALLAQEKVSHFDWLDSDTLLVWARFSGGGLASMRARGQLGHGFLKPVLNLARKFTGRWKKKLLSEAYYQISLMSSESRIRFGWPTLDADGHPMVARTHGWIVTDFYPDRYGRVPVILYDPARKRRIDVHEFIHNPRTSDSDAKCDLHPRWSRSGRHVSVDTCEFGNRQVRILDVANVVS